MSSIEGYLDISGRYSVRKDVILVLGK